MMRRLARLLPSSLVGQLLLATTLALVAAQLVNFVVVTQAQRAERGAVLAAAAAAAIAESTDRLALGLPLPMGPRERMRGRDGRPGPDGDVHLRRDRPGPHVRAIRRRVTVGSVPDMPAGMGEYPALAGRVANLLDDAEVSVTQVRAAAMDIAPRTRRDGRRVSRIIAVAAQIPDGRWITVRAPVAVTAQRVQLQLLGQTLVLFVLLLLPLLWITRRAAAPLALLTRTARTAMPGQMPVVAEAGPADVRDLTRAFNDLSQRVRTMLVDKDRMLGAVGHDLRTPLASLRVRIERVDDVALRDAMSATIADMAMMLDDITALARSGQPHELAAPTDLAGLLADLVDDYTAMARPVRLAAEGVVATALVRGAALRRALRNLIDNAVTYGGEAELGLTRVGERLRISVADRGPGIPADRISDMLEPFARAEESRNRATGGSGLGLALAKAIAEGEGGELVLTSREGGGLVATIELPDTRHT